jgi:predicted outer membrane repeat protein
MKKKLSWVVILLTAAIFALPTLSLLGQTSTPTPAPDVFGTAPVQAAADANTTIRSRGVIRSRTATLNRAAVPDTQAAAASTPLGQLRLNLFPDVNLLADQLRTEANNAIPTGYVWVGSVPGDPYSQVVLSIGSGQMAGFVQTQSGLYQIKSSGSLQIITEVDPSAFDSPTGTDAVAHPPLPRSPQAAAPDVQALAAGQTAIVDIMVVYTLAARTQLGGDVAAQNEIQAAITAANQAYLNSGVNLRLNLVHTELATYTESGDMGTDLDRVTYGGDNILDNVLTLRDTYKADLVTLVTYMGSSGLCGLGWQFMAEDLPAPQAFAPYAFHVVSADCLVANLTLAHEAGHNMGANHDIGNIGNGPRGPYPYAYGYIDPLGKFRTVMSYAAGCSQQPCPRVTYFSNITRTLDGRVLGNINANNAQVLNNTAPYIAAFRSGSTTPVVLTPTPVPPVFSPTAVPTTTPAPGCNVNVPAGSAAALINAIDDANANGNSQDVICLAPNSTYVFSSINNFYQSDGMALPRITTPMTILGGNATLQWNTGAGNARFFGVDASINPQAQLTLDSVTLLNGRVTNYGGTIFNTGTLNLNNVTFRNNIAGNLGGAIYNLGPMNITDSRFYGNSASQGGAIYAASGVNPASVIMTRTLLQENDATYGSAVYAYGSTALIYANGSCFVRNTNMSVYNLGAPNLNLGANWWNASYGPTLYTGSTQGEGDRLGPSGITYTPFLTGAPYFCTDGPSGPGAAPGLNYNQTGQPTLTWTALSWATSYQVQVATTTAFTTLEFNQVVSGTQVTLPPASSLPEGTHYWRVRGCTLPTACTGTWSTPQVLTVDLP